MNVKSFLGHLTPMNVPLHSKYSHLTRKEHSVLRFASKLRKKYHKIMKKLVTSIVSFLSLLEMIFGNECVNDTVNSRITRGTDGGKRYLIFPQGSNVQLIYCMTIGTYAKPQGIFTMGVTAGLAYELPHKDTVLNRKPAEVYHRRSRRELYRKVELMLNTRGKDGRACVLKALCLSGQRNSSQVGKGSFMDEILHSVFTLSKGSYEIDPKTDYELAHESEEDCHSKYSSCPNLF